jgi:hypothetical protein
MQTTIVVVPEWLSGMTRNHVGFARAGSSPADHVFCFIFLFLLCVTVCLSPWTKTHWTCVARPAKITLSCPLSWLGRARRGRSRIQVLSTVGRQIHGLQWIVL